MASIIGDWYHLDVKKVAYLVIIPAIGALIGQVLIGWNSDRTHERRWHASLPIIIGAAALVFIPDSNGTKWLTITLFTLAMIGMKAYLPAFWALPSLFLTESAAAASIGLINSCGNLGGAVGPSVLGVVKQATGSYRYGLWFLSVSVILSAMIIAGLGIGTQAQHKLAESASEPEPEADQCVMRRGEIRSSLAAFLLRSLPISHTRHQNQFISLPFVMLRRTRRPANQTSRPPPCRDCKPGRRSCSHQEEP